MNEFNTDVKYDRYKGIIIIIEDKVKEPRREKWSLETPGSLASGKSTHIFYLSKSTTLTFLLEW